MEETGRVVKIYGDVAEVMVERKAACQGCGACRMVSEKEMLIEAENGLHAAVGDIVSVFLPEEKVLEASALTYVVPLLSFFAGYFAGKTVSRWLGFEGNETGAILAAFIALAAAFLSIRKIIGSSPGAANRYRPQIKTVIRQA